MEQLLQFTLALAIALVAAKAAGYLSSRLGQPAVLGELLIGLVLGPTLLDMLSWSFLGSGHLEEVFHQLSHLGVLLLMFVAGLEVDLKAMLQAGRPAALAGSLGVVAPVLLGALVALPFGFGVQQSLAIGLILAATSVSISAQTLMELGVLRSRVGLTLLGAAVVDDVLAILLLSLFLAVATGSGGGALAVLWILVRVVAFLGLASALGVLLLPRLLAFIGRLPISEGLLAATFVIVLLYSWGAEALGGVAAITGSFLAGVLIARSTLRRSIEGGMHALTYSWLVPIFFVSIGLSVDAKALSLADLGLELAIVGAAMLSKVLGAGLGAHLGGFSAKESLRLGVGMASRGEVGLIVAAAESEAGLIDDRIFALVVMMVLATTLLTPLLLRALYPRGERKARTAED